ncbi:MAG: PAS domain-containing protein [Myxococcales bacterium]|nr:PAS domain-containing protein [Myxococcales bacterium]
MSDSEQSERDAGGDPFLALIDTIPQIAWMAAPDGHITYFNARWTEYVGGPTDPARGNWLGALHPDERGPVRQAYQAALAHGRAFEIEFRLRRRDGSYRWHLARGVPTCDEHGRVTRWSGTATDIEDARRAASERAALVAREQAAGHQLAVSEARYRSLVHAISQLVWTADASGEVVEDSPSWRAFTGQTLEQWLGRGWLAALHPDDREATADEWRRCVAAQTAYAAEYRVRRRDGVYRVLLARGAPVRDRDGAVREWIGVNTDISEHKEAEASRAALLVAEQAARAEAEAANRLKDEFLATLSHELRTPLSAILGWATMLRRGKQGDPAAVARGAEVIERNARAQKHIIEDILDMSRIIRGELRIATEAIDLPALAGEVLETVRPSAAARAIRLECSVGAGSLRIVGDAARLRQVVWNLLANAIKFTDADGEVTLTLSRDGDEVELAVRDTGCGIDPEFLPHVFERFRQADSSTTRVHGGLGLGLAIVRSLVEMHGGRVHASSGGPGCGARFCAVFPASGAPRAAPPPVSQPAPVGARAGPAAPQELLHGARILLVEDEDDTREMLGLLLSQAGAELRSAASAETAIASLAEFTPDLLLSDVAMPGGDGLRLLPQLRARLPGLPSIALSAYAESEDSERARDAGFDAYLVKPVEADRLLASVARVLTTLQARR